MVERSNHTGTNLLARYGLALGFCVCAAHAASPTESDSALVVRLEGQRKFLDDSIAFCMERVPALKAALTDARLDAEQQINKAEGVIGGQIASSAGRDRSRLDKYQQMWSRNAAQLLEALRKQNAAEACPVLRDNWVGIEAEVIVEDWQNFLDRSLAEESEPHGRAEPKVE